MKHGKWKLKLNRTSSHRNHLLRNLATSLIMHARIKTTVAKAKALKPIADKMVTLGKRNTAASRIKLNGYLYSQPQVMPKLDELVRRYADRAGGYTRIIRMGHRRGDKAPMAMIEYVGQNLDTNEVDFKCKLTIKQQAFEALQQTKLKDKVNLKQREKLLIQKRQKSLDKTRVQNGFVSEDSWIQVVQAEMQKLKISSS